MIGADGFCPRCQQFGSFCRCPPLAVVPDDLAAVIDIRPDTPAARHARPGGDGDGEQRMTRAEQLRAALLDSAGLDTLPDPVPLIDGVLYCDTLAWLHGKPGHGKSFIALDWACCISAGLPWQDCEVRQGTVLYVIAEGVTGLRQRVRAWEDYAGQKTGVMFLPVAVQLLDGLDHHAVIGLAAELNPALIVVDTQARVTVGADENSAKDMGELVASIDRIRAATQACILVVHHEARAGENMRGSTALEGAASTMIRVTKDGSHLTVENRKQKDAPEFEPMQLMLTPRLGSAVVTALDGFTEATELAASERKLLAVLRDTFGELGASRTNLLEVSGLPKTTFYRAANRLREMGEIVNVGTRNRPHYVLPDMTDSKFPNDRGTNTCKATGDSHEVPPIPTDT